MPAPKSTPDDLWKYKILANLPIVLLFVLSGFFYLNYLQIYLLKLLTGTYTANTSDTTSTLEGSTAFITLKTVTRYTNQIMTEMLASTTDFATQQQKGIVYAIILHIFAFFFLFSVLRVIFTNPGRVPQDWNSRVEGELNKAIEFEKRVLKNIRRQAKRKQIYEDGGQPPKIIMDLGGNIFEDSKVPTNTYEFSGASDTLQDTTGVHGAGEDVHQQESQGDVASGEEERLQTENFATDEINFTQGQGGPNGETEEHADNHISEEEMRERHELAMKMDIMDLRSEEVSTDKLHQLAVMSALSRGKRRFCAHCQRFKPERTHHCRQCGTCVLRMDHHCPWVNNCVGVRNYKYFLTMLLYADACLIFIAITFTEVITDTLFDTTISSFKLYYYLVYYLLAAIMGVILFIFFSFHLWLIANGKTTLEFCEKKPDSSYDQGIVTNFVVTCGSFFPAWIFPYRVDKETGVDNR